MRRFLRPRTCLLAAILGLASCGGDNVPTAYYVRAVHAIQDAPVLQVNLTGIPVFSALDYGQVSALIPPVVRESDTQLPLLEIVGLVPGDDNIVVIEQELDLRAGVEYTLVTTGTVAEPRLIVTTTERRTKPVSATYLQVTHAAVDLGPLDVFLTGPDDDLVGATPFATLSPGEFTDSLEVLQQEHRIRVTASGTTDVLADSGTQDFSDSAEWHLALVDNLSAGGGSVRMLLSNARRLIDVLGGDRSASLRPIFMARSPAAVDVLASDPAIAVGQGVGYLQAVPHVPVPGATLPVTVTAAADPADVLLDAAAGLEDGNDYSYWVFEREGAVQGQTLVDRRRSVVTEGRLRFLQGIESSDLFTVYLSTEAPVGQPPLAQAVVRDAVYASFSGVVRRKPGIYFLTVTSRASTSVVDETVLVLAQELQLSGGEVLSIVIAPASQSETAPALTILDDQQF